jgi:hypothetical protein
MLDSAQARAAGLLPFAGIDSSVPRVSSSARCAKVRAAAHDSHVASLDLHVALPSEVERRAGSAVRYRRKPLRLAALVTAAHGFFRSARGAPSFMPAMI